MQERGSENWKNLTKKFGTLGTDYSDNKSTIQDKITKIFYADNGRA